MKYKTLLAFVLGAAAALGGLATYEIQTRETRYIEDIVFDPPRYTNELAESMEVPKGAEFWYSLNGNYISPYARFPLDRYGIPVQQTKDFRALARQLCNNGPVLNLWWGQVIPGKEDKKPTFSTYNGAVTAFAIVEQGTSNKSHIGDEGNDYWGLLYVEQLEEKEALAFVVRAGYDVFPLIPAVSNPGGFGGVWFNSPLGYRRDSATAFHRQLMVTGDSVSSDFALYDRRDLRSFAPDELMLKRAQEIFLNPENGMPRIGKSPESPTFGPQDERRNGPLCWDIVCAQSSSQLSRVLANAAKDWPHESLTIPGNDHLADVHMHHIAAFQNIRKLDVDFYFADHHGKMRDNNTYLGGAEIRPLDKLETLIIRGHPEPLTFLAMYSYPGEDWHSGAGAVSLKEIEFRNLNLGSDMRSQDLSNLKTVESIRLERCWDVEAGMRSLATIPNLKKLTLKDCRSAGLEKDQLFEVLKGALPSVEITWIEK